MKNNFTNADVNILSRLVGRSGYVTVNKAGNLNVVFYNTRYEEKYTLYLTSNKKYLWRRHIGYGYCYPLNMKRPVSIKNKSNWNDEIFIYRPYNTTNSEFNTINEAFDYFFNKYLVKFPCTSKGNRRMI